jgi:hypothetical protein
VWFTVAAGGNIGELVVGKVVQSAPAGSRERKIKTHPTTIEFPTKKKKSQTKISAEQAHACCFRALLQLDERGTRGLLLR